MEISTLVDNVRFKIVNYIVAAIGVPPTIFAMIYAKIKAQERFRTYKCATQRKLNLSA